MSDPKGTMEERILEAVKMTLTHVIKDTATPAGMRHPLTPETIEDLRQCLALISARERELAEAAGQLSSRRPRYSDEPPDGPQVVRFHKPMPPGEPD